MKRGIITIMICALYLCAQPAQATLITIQIEAVVDSVSDDYGYLEGKIKPGDTITGFYTYESKTPDSSPSATVGRYEHLTPPYGIFLTVGGFDFETDKSNVDFRIDIINNSATGRLHDGYGFISYNNSLLSNGTSVDTILWWLEDTFTTALSSTELPTTAPVLEDWQTNLLRLDGERRSYHIDAHVTSAIPEPATILSFSFGLLLMRKRT